jgi:leader peptidase (prepilin peptidase)/N-methyltransferase
MLTAALFATAAHWGLSTGGLFWVVAYSILIAIFFIDLDHMIIPDRFSLGLILWTLAFAIADPGVVRAATGIQALFSVGAGFVAGTVVVTWAILLGEVAFHKEAMGMGDIKLLAGLGALFGVASVFVSFFLGAVIGCVFLGASWLLGKAGVKLPSYVDGERHLPFGPLLIAGALLYHFWPGFIDVQWVRPLGDVWANLRAG